MRLFFMNAKDNGGKLKKLYSELWDNSSGKSEDEQGAIMDQMNKICEEALQYQAKVLTVFLRSAEDAASYFETFKKEALKSKLKNTQEASMRTLKAAEEEHAKIAAHLQNVGVKSQTLEEKIGHGSPQDKKIQECINKHNLKKKYEKKKYTNAKFGTPEHIKKDFWDNFNFKYHSLDEAINERVNILKKEDTSMDYDKYKKALLKGFPSNMEEFVNLIEPGWSKKAAAPEAGSQDPKVGGRRW